MKTPVPLIEKVTASVETVQIREDKTIVTLPTIRLNCGGQVMVDGEAVEVDRFIQLCEEANETTT